MVPSLLGLSGLFRRKCALYNFSVCITKTPTSCLDTYCPEHYTYVLARSLTRTQPHTHSLATLQLGSLPENKVQVPTLKGY